MGSYMMHLAVSNNVKKKLKLSDDFLYGSLLPDILKEEGQDRKINHYLKEETINGSIRRLPDISRAIGDIDKFENKEIALGYIAHLIEDYIWFSVYIPSYVEEKEDKCIYLKDNSVHSIQEFRKDIYSDYESSNKYILGYMKENIEELKNRLEKIADTKERKEKVKECMSVNKLKNIKNNIFMTKESIDSYIEIATKEVERIISKLINEKNIK